MLDCALVRLSALVVWLCWSHGPLLQKCELGDCFCTFPRRIPSCLILWLWKVMSACLALFCENMKPSIFLEEFLNRPLKDCRILTFQVLRHDCRCFTLGSWVDKSRSQEVVCHFRTQFSCRSATSAMFTITTRIPSTTWLLCMNPPPISSHRYLLSLCLTCLAQSR